MSTKCAFGNRNANFHALQVSGVPLRNRRVLEIGCGNGYLGEYVRSLGATVVGCDITLPATAPDVQFVQADGAALPFGQQFDVVMSFDVLEHIPDTDQHLREVRRVLRPAGSTVVNDVVMSRRRSDDVLHVERRCRRPSAAIRVGNRPSAL